MNTRPPCRYCGAPVTSTVDTVDYCRDCYYSGTAHDAAFAALLAELPTGTEAWHTGGGCFAIHIPTADGYMLATEEDGVLPDTEEGPWMLGRYTVDTDGDPVDDGIILAEGLGRADLIARVAAEVTP